MPVWDVAQTYTDIVTAIFSSTIAAKAWFATAADVVAYVVSISGAAG